MLPIKKKILRQPTNLTNRSNTGRKVGFSTMNPTTLRSSQLSLSDTEPSQSKGSPEVINQAMTE